MNKLTKKLIQYAGGQVRYFTYWLIFPDDEAWVEQKPFTGRIEEEVLYTRWRKNPDVCRALSKHGNYSFKDHNGVTHKIVVEEQERPRVWGVRRNRWR